MERVKPKAKTEDHLDVGARARGETRDGVVPIEQLEAALAIDEHALDQAEMRQADAYYRVAKACAILTSKRDAAKQSVAESEAQAAIEIRETAEKRSEKVSVAEVGAMVTVDRDVSAATKDYLRLSGLVMQYAALERAFTQRSHALSGLIDLHGKGYFSEVRGKQQNNEIRNAEAERRRQDMADMRKGLRGRE